MKKVVEGGKVVEVIFTDEDLDAWNKDWWNKCNEMLSDVIDADNDISLRFEFSYRDNNHNICVGQLKFASWDNNGGYVRPGESKNFSGVKVTNRCRRP